MVDQNATLGRTIKTPKWDYFNGLISLDEFSNNCHAYGSSIDWLCGYPQNDVGRFDVIREEYYGPQSKCFAGDF